MANLPPWKPGIGAPSQQDSETLYKAVNDLTSQINEVRTLAEQGGTSTPQNPFATLAPCSPFVIDRVVEPKGEKPVFCVNFAPTDAVKKLVTVLREYKHDGVTLQDIKRRITDTYRDITDAEAQAGTTNYIFGVPLDFDRQFALWQLKLHDEMGNVFKARDENSTTPLAIFTTGQPGLNGPASHNWFRNGRFERSKYNWNNSTDPKPDPKQLECKAWFVGCDRAVPVAAAGHPSYNAGLYWDKARGKIFWNVAARTLSQRLPQRILRAEDIFHCLGWIRRTLAVNPINADLEIRFVSVNDQRALGGSLVKTTIVSTIIPQIGGAGGATGPSAPTITDIVIDPDPIPVEVTIATSWPFQRSQQVPASYSLTTTPVADGSLPNDSSGQWIEFALLNVTGAGYFEFDRFRAGYGDGDYTPHPKELDDTDETGIGPSEVTIGGGRGGGYTYGSTPQSLYPGRGAILRPSTD